MGSKDLDEIAIAGVDAVERESEQNDEILHDLLPEPDAGEDLRSGDAVKLSLVELLLSAAAPPATAVAYLRFMGQPDTPMWLAASVSAFF